VPILGDRPVRHTHGHAAAGEALGVGVIDKLPKAPLGVAADATDDDVDDAGCRLRRGTPCYEGNTGEADARVECGNSCRVAIQEFNTRLVKTILEGRATFLGNERRGAFLVGQAGKSFDTVSDGNREEKE